MSDDLENRVLNWLAKQGYPFEMRVGALFRQSGWHVDHAVLFTDPDTGKARDLDLIATLRVKDDRSHDFSFMLAVECKTSKEKPWVAFSAPRQRVPKLIQHVIALDRMSQSAIHTAVAHDLALPHFLQFDSVVAHGAVRAFADSSAGDPTGPFAAVRAVLSAGTDLGATRTRWAWNGKTHPPL